MNEQVDPNKVEGEIVVAGGIDEGGPCSSGQSQIGRFSYPRATHFVTILLQTFPRFSHRKPATMIGGKKPIACDQILENHVMSTEKKFAVSYFHKNCNWSHLAD